jgi:transposase InsO family protein
VKVSLRFVSLTGELTHPSEPARTGAILEWVAWFSTQRLLEPLGYVPPAEFEERFHCAQTTLLAEVVLT